MRPYLCLWYFSAHIFCTLDFIAIYRIASHQRLLHLFNFHVFSQKFYDNSFFWTFSFIHIFCRHALGSTSTSNLQINHMQAIFWLSMKNLRRRSFSLWALPASVHWKFNPSYSFALSWHWQCLWRCAFILPEKLTKTMHCFGYWRLHIP